LYSWLNLGYVNFTIR